MTLLKRKHLLKLVLLDYENHIDLTTPVNPLNALQFWFRSNTLNVQYSQRGDPSALLNIRRILPISFLHQPVLKRDRSHWSIIQCLGTLSKTPHRICKKISNIRDAIIQSLVATPPWDSPCIRYSTVGPPSTSRRFCFGVHRTVNCGIEIRAYPNRQKTSTSGALLDTTTRTCFPTSRG